MRHACRLETLAIFALATRRACREPAGGRGDASVVLTRWPFSHATRLPRTSWGRYDTRVVSRRSPFSLSPGDAPAENQPRPMRHVCRIDHKRFQLSKIIAGALRRPPSPLPPRGPACRKVPFWQTNAYRIISAKIVPKMNKISRIPTSLSIRVTRTWLAQPSLALKATTPAVALVAVTAER